jgi:TolB-like protein
VKKFLLIVLFLVLLTGALSAQEMNLHQVIVSSARAVEEVLPQGAMVAVLNFVSSSEAFSDYIIEELTGELVTGRKVTVVDRRNLALLAQEMNLQLSGEVSDDSALAIGRLLGARSVVSGSLSNMGTFHRFRVSVISVETAAIQTQVAFNLRNDAQVAFLLGDSAASVSPAPQQRSARQPAQRLPREPNYSDDAWVYLGGGLGFGRAAGSFLVWGAHGDMWMWTKENYHTNYLIPFFTADFILTNFLAIGTIVGCGFTLDNNDTPIIPAIAILAKLGGKIGRIELTANAGYFVDLGFGLGATFGFNIGPGILFAEIGGIPWPSQTDLDYAYFVSVGYKIGVGRNRR